MPTPQVTIIGAGILGATIAFALTEAGAKVRVIERLSAPGGGVTARSFGWVNAVIAEPGGADQRLRHQAFGRYDDLNRRLGGRLFQRRKGSLFWTSSDAATEAHASACIAAGCDMRLVTRSEIATLAPQLARPPRAAAHSPSDYAFEPADASRLLIDAAREAGADILLGAEAQGVERTATGAVVHVGGEHLETDLLVVAAGTAIQNLLPDAAPDLRIDASPSALVTIEAAPAALDCILCGPELEIRRRAEGVFVAADDVPENATDEDLAHIAANTEAAVKRLLPALGAPRIRSVEIGQRPVPRGETALIARLEAAPSVIAAAAHPGVILAPLVAETIADIAFGRDPRSGIEPKLIGA